MPVSAPLPMLDEWLVHGCLWLVTYALHSTLFLGGAWLVTSRGLLRSDGLVEMVWKLALVGGVVTATVQLGFGLTPFGGRVALPIGLSAGVSDEQHPVGSETGSPSDADHRFAAEHGASESSASRPTPASGELASHPAQTWPSHETEPGSEIAPGSEIRAF